MKFLIDPSIVPKLEEVYGTKTPQVILNALTWTSPEIGLIEPVELTYDEVIRRQKISQRKDVALHENARDILHHLNLKSLKNFRPTETNLNLISSLLKKKYTRKEIETVIDNKAAKWLGTSMEDYLRPSTLFRASNFDAYVNEGLAPEVAVDNFASELDSMLGAK